jgi:hypothetical protein
LVSDLAQRHDDLHVLEQRQLFQEKGTTAAKLGRARLVFGRGAPGRGGDVTVTEAKAVVAVG